MGWYGGGAAVGMWVIMILFWLLLIGAIVWLALVLTKLARQADSTAPGAPPGATRPSQPPPPPQGPSPLEVLDHRLAGGEIDLETYHQIRATLLGPRGGPG
jgi:uncharacterized membrane protein